MANSDNGLARADPVRHAADLLALGKPQAAADAIRALAADASATEDAISLHAAAVGSAGQPLAALEIVAGGLHKFPASAPLLSRKALLEEQAGWFGDAEATARDCLAAGRDSPALRAVLARALHATGRLAEAEAVYRQAVARHPDNAELQRDLAQLVWMVTGNADAATEELRRAVAAYPLDTSLPLQLAKAYRYAGDLPRAIDTLDATIGRVERITPELEVSAASILLQADNEAAAMRHAERAIASQPGYPPAVLAYCDCNVAMGRHERAVPLLARLHQRLPDAQQVTARLATVWRLIGDCRYGELYDYAQFVAKTTLDAPPPWRTSSHFFDDLSAALRRMHTAGHHPYDQSLRDGSQTFPDLTAVQSPEVQSFFAAVKRPIERVLGKLGNGSGPVRSRNVGAYRVHSAWSVLMAGGGKHLDHVHQYGWLSAVCYVDIPAEAVDRNREGWLKFGQPGIKTRPELAPDFFVKPVRGELALFPSYMWHGTLPFRGEGSRMTIAFDIVPPD